jgi:hypothetical protein
MRFRLLVGALMVCALVGAEAAPVAGAAPKRVYKGKTKQKRVVRLSARGNSIKLRHFTAKLKCKDGSVLIDEESGFQRTQLRNGGRFDDIQVGSTDEVFFRGRAKNNLIRGKIRVTDRLHKHGARCRSRWIEFSAKKRG